MKQIIIQGILYDEKSSFLKGSRLAPPLIRETLYSPASNLFTENGTNIDTPKIIDKGDFEISDYHEIDKITRENLEDSDRIISLGGDHSITYPILRAFSNFHPSVDILHFDAHPDLYDKLNGDKLSHACPFARIMENGLALRLVQVGIRTLNDHQKQQAEKFGVEIHEMRNLDIDRIPQFKNPLYISVDMDAFDPAFAPGVSHQEPGGLTARQAIDIIHRIDQKIIGADIVEFNPKRDSQNITAALAAKMTKEILGKMLERD